MVVLPVDRAIFSWRQIKEMFGGLSMSARFSLTLDLLAEGQAAELKPLLLVVAPEKIEQIADDQIIIRVAVICG